MKAALRSVHPADDVAAMSSYYMAEEVRTTFAGMMIVLPAAVWAAFGRLPVGSFAAGLRRLAGRVDPKRYRKAKRGPKRPPPSNSRYRNGGDVRPTACSNSRNADTDTLEALPLRG